MWPALLLLSLLGGPARGAPPEPFVARKATPNATIEGFSCARKGTHGATLCRGSFDPKIYPLEVVFVIPAAFHPEKRAELVLHLHGHVDKDETFSGTLKEYRFEELFPATGRNAVLVVPASIGKCETYRDWLMPGERFKAFLAAVGERLVGAGLATEPEPEKLTLSGHSGAYRTIEAIVEGMASGGPRVSEVFLFDSLYNDGAAFLPYLKTLRLYSVFLPLKHKKTGAWRWTAKGNFELWRSLHPAEPVSGFLKSTLPPEAGWRAIERELSRESPVLMRSDVSHVKTVGKYFPKALRVR